MGLVHAGFCDAVDFEDLRNVPEAELVVRNIVVSLLSELGAVHFVASLLMHLLQLVFSIAYSAGVTAILAVCRPRSLFR